MTTSVVSEEASTVSLPETGPGASPRTTLQRIKVCPISHRIAKQLVEREHYLHSLPGGTHMAFGVFLGIRMLGVITIGAGPMKGYSIVEGAMPDDCLSLTRMWLSDELPRGSESRVLGFVLRALKRHTDLKFLLTYADPQQGHAGTIYQATNWIYTGLSAAMPLYDLGDGAAIHSRTLSHAFGTHSVSYFADHGIEVKRVPQTGKHRYIYFLDSRWSDRLRLPALQYPKKESADDRSD